MSGKRFVRVRLTLKWKLTLGSALLLFLLFAAYNLVQYAFVEGWMKKQAEHATQQDMREILNDLLEKERSFQKDELPAIRNKLEKINERGQVIRVLNRQGEIVVSVEDDMPAGWGAYYPKGSMPSSGTWFLEGQLLLMHSPLTIFDFDGTVEIIKSVEDFGKLSSAFFRVMLICCLGAVIISGIGGWLLARQLLKPLKAMNDTMLSVKEKGLQERITLQASDKDELSALMLRFNEMMDQLERSFEQQKQFVEDASHELRTPVAIIEGHLRMLQRWGKADPAIVDEALDASAQELVRLKKLVEELLLLSRAEKSLPDGQAWCADAAAVIRRVAANVSMLHPQFAFRLAADSLAGISLHVSERHLEQILLILLDNAVKYSVAVKRIELTGELGKGTAIIRVIDCGMGIEETDLPYVLDRFYRADKARNRDGGGYGLGLAIARRLVESYAGSLRISSRKGEGTTAEVVFKAELREK
jgi:two-component system sensor histidine kinase ArlS